MATAEPVIRKLCMAGDSADPVPLRLGTDGCSRCDGNVRGPCASRAATCSSQLTKTQGGFKLAGCVKKQSFGLYLLPKTWAGCVYTAALCHACLSTERFVLPPVRDSCCQWSGKLSVQQGTYKTPCSHVRPRVSAAVRLNSIDAAGRRAGSIRSGGAGITHRADERVAHQGPCAVPRGASAAGGAPPRCWAALRREGAVSCWESPPRAAGPPLQGGPAARAVRMRPEGPPLARPGAALTPASRRGARPAGRPPAGRQSGGGRPRPAAERQPGGPGPASAPPVAAQPPAVGTRACPASQLRLQATASRVRRFADTTRAYGGLISPANTLPTSS